VGRPLVSAKAVFAHSESGSALLPAIEAHRALWFSGYMRGGGAPGWVIGLGLCNADRVGSRQGGGLKRATGSDCRCGFSRPSPPASMNPRANTSMPVECGR